MRIPTPTDETLSLCEVQVDSEEDDISSDMFLVTKKRLTTVVLSPLITPYIPLVHKRGSAVFLDDCMYVIPKWM